MKYNFTIELHLLKCFPATHLTSHLPLSFRSQVHREDRAMESVFFIMFYYFLLVLARAQYSLLDGRFAAQHNTLSCGC